MLFVSGRLLTAHLTSALSQQSAQNLSIASYISPVSCPFILLGAGRSGCADCHVGSNLMSRGIKGISEYRMLPSACSPDSPLFGAGQYHTLQAKDQKTLLPLSASCHQGPGCSWAYGQDAIYLLVAEGSLSPGPIQMVVSRSQGKPVQHSR